MRNTKQYGLVSSWQEHQMLIRAQHTYEKLHSKRKPAYSKRVPAFSLDNAKRRCGEMPRVRRCRYPGCHAMVQLPAHYCKQHYEHEAGYQANRQRWARSHNQQYQHKYNAQTRNRNATKHDQYQFYRSRQWQRLREQALERDHYICQYCGQPNSDTVDHIVPIEYDGALKDSLDNLATICRQCHRLKTDWEHSWYGTGIDNRRKRVAELHDVLSIKYLMNKDNGS